MADTSRSGELNPQQGDVFVSGIHLLPLLHRVRLNGSEWRAILAVLLYGPSSARQIAKRLRLDYSPAKRVIRGLVEWQILRRTSEGVAFQPDATRWGRPRITR
jgi:hypothetical protein